MPNCPLCGTPFSGSPAHCPECGNPFSAGSSWKPGAAGGDLALGQAARRDEETIARLAGYEKFSGILWLVIAGLQMLTCLGFIAGLWNLFAGISRLRLVKPIRERRSFVPAAYEPYGQLVALGIINLLLGGIVGVAFVLFDFHTRDEVLKNARLFDRP